jgi:nucleoside-diphosphate-sugar epimerase
VRVLVTGGSGFVGSHVVEELAKQGHSLRLTLRRTSSLAFLRGIDFERVEADLRDATALRAAAKGVDAVVHLAGLTTALGEAEYFRVNAQGTASLADAAAEAGVKRFVYLSSLAARGPSLNAEGAMPETPRPLSVYGRSKLDGEVEALRFAEHMTVAILRAPVIYGPRDRGLLPFFKLIKLGVAPVYADGANRLSWVHAHDFATAIAALVQADSVSGVYTIADGPPHTWRELTGALGRALDKRPFVINVPPALYSLAGASAELASNLIRRPLLLNRDKVKEMRQRNWVCDYDRMAQELGWKPQVGLEEGLQATVRWYREHAWL